MKIFGSHRYVHELTLSTDEVVTIPNYSGRKSARFRPSWIRITAYQSLHAPRIYLYLGGPRQRSDGRQAHTRDLSIDWLLEEDGSWRALRPNPLDAMPWNLEEIANGLAEKLKEAWQ